MERINQWLMLIANAGVIAGIVFLAYELRVNTQALSVATSTSYLENFMQLSADAAADAEIAALADTATFQGWDAVPLEQRGRVISYRQSQLKASEFAHFQWSEGLLDDRLWASNALGLYGYLWVFDDAREIYRGLRYTFYSGFQQYMDQMIADICSRKTCRPEDPFLRTGGAQLEALEAWEARGP